MQRIIVDMRGQCVGFFMLLLTLIGYVSVRAHPFAYEKYRFINNEDMTNPGIHQLASWITSQFRRNDLTALLDEIIINPYRSPLHNKRNSEVTNAIIGSEETQKMYKDGKK